MKPADVSADRMNAGFGVALFGIKDPARLVKEARRLGVRLASPADARAWMALTGHDGLDVVRDSVLAQRKEANLLALLGVAIFAAALVPSISVTSTASVRSILKICLTLALLPSPSPLPSRSSTRNSC